MRVEQIYPWPEAKLAEIFGRYSAATTRVWVHEEPRNMGPWTFGRDRLQAILADVRLPPDQRAPFCARPPSLPN